MVPDDVKGLVSGSLRIESPRWESNVEEVDKEVFSYLAKELEDFLGGAKAELKVDLRLEKEVRINDLMFEKLRPLNGRVTFRLRKGGE